MKTRFTPLVKIKKNSMDKCEQDLSRAYQNRQNAEAALEAAYLQLQQTTSLTQGTMHQMLQERTILDIQRSVIQDKRAWLHAASEQVVQFQESLRQSVIEYEKFKYLETKEVEAALKKRAKNEIKSLDESALHSFMYQADQR
jgi:flagellar export protein FliJ